MRDAGLMESLGRHWLWADDGYADYFDIGSGNFSFLCGTWFGFIAILLP